MNEIADLNLVTVFEAVWRHRQISRAAAELNSSQPTVSNALRRLREIMQPLGRTGQSVVAMDDVGRPLDLLPTRNASLAALARSRSHVMVESECVPTSHLSHDRCALRVIAFDNICLVEKVDRCDRHRALQ